MIWYNLEDSVGQESWELPQAVVAGMDPGLAGLARRIGGAAPSCDSSPEGLLEVLWRYFEEEPEGRGEPMVAR